MASTSDIISSIISSIKTDSTKSEKQKDDMINFLTTQEKSQQKFKISTSHLEEKFECLISFIKFIEINIPSSSTKIYGSFVRQMFEKMFLSSYDDSGYGDSENHDVDCTVFESKEKYEESKKEFNNVIDTFEVMEKLDFSASIKFGNFYLVKISDITMNLSNNDVERLERLRKNLDSYIISYNARTNNPINITDTILPSRNMMRTRLQINKLAQNIKEKFNNVPHFNIIMKNPSNNKYVIIDMFGFPIKENEYNIQDDINVNTLCITRDGINCKSDFLTTIRSIYKRKGITCIDIVKMKKNLENKSLIFSEKTKIYNQLVNFIGFRTKILASGYSEISSENEICDMYVEHNEICPITSAKPPYMCMNLQCGHSLSIMALAGIANIRKSDYTEEISCPLCRSKLIPKMLEKQPEHIEIPDPSIVSQIFTTGQSRRNSISINIPKPVQNEIMTSENISTIFQHLGLKPYIESIEGNNVDNNMDNNVDNNVDNNYE